MYTSKATIIINKNCAFARVLESRDIDRIVVSEETWSYDHWTAETNAAIDAYESFVRLADEMGELLRILRSYGMRD